MGSAWGLETPHGAERIENAAIWGQGRGDGTESPTPAPAPEWQGCGRGACGPARVPGTRATHPVSERNGAWEGGGGGRRPGEASLGLDFLSSD